MLKKHLQKILLLFITLAITSLQAAHFLEQDEGNHSDDGYIIPNLIYYTNQPVDNRVLRKNLKDEKDNFRDNHITKKIKDKKGLIFFMLIASNKQTNKLHKFFFFNRAPNKEKEAIKRVTSLYKCEVISRTKPMLSPHLIVQVLGWMAQSSGVYKPKFIHANGPLCITCHAIVSNLFNLDDIPTDAKNGCNGAKKLELTKMCPLAQQYINSCLTLALAKKILLPQVTYKHTNQLKTIKNKLKKHLFDNILIGHTDQVMSVAITKDNKYIVSGSSDSTIQIWNLNTGKKVDYSRLYGHTKSVYAVAVTNDNQYIVSGSYDHTIRIWDFKKGKEVNYSPLKGHTSSVESVAISSDNKYIVSGSFDKTIRIWYFKTGKQLPYSPLTGHQKGIYSVDITKDNKYIVSGSDDGTIRIWGFKTGKEVAYSPLTGHTGNVWRVAITKDNRYIVSSSNDRTIRIWNFKTGKELPYSPLKGHTGVIYSVAISSDSKYIISGSGDKTIRIWDFKTGKELGEIPLTSARTIWSVAVTSDNKYIVSGSTDKAIRTWNWKLFNEIIAQENGDQNEQKEDQEVFDIN